MKILKNLLGWVFSISFLMGGIACFTSGNRIIPAILFLLAGLIINPLFVTNMNKQQQEKAKLAGTEAPKFSQIPLWIMCFIFVGIAIWILPRPNRGQVASSSSSNSSSPQSAKKWVQVYMFKGNGMKKSPLFDLSGGEAKIVYNYRGDTDLGVGFFGAYLFKEGDAAMTTGGIPEVMTQAVKEQSESAIQKPAGRYYLDIQATGDWIVGVEEYK